VTAPMTPSDCDLRGLPFMPMDVVRVLDSDLFALSTGDEFKAALALWCKAWLQIPAASLPDDDRVLAHLSGSGSRWKRIKGMALRGWVKCDDGRLYHPVIAEKAAEAWKHRQAQRHRANKRWGNTDSGASGNATANASASTTAHATASPAAMQGTGTVKKKKEESPPKPPALPADLQAVMDEAKLASPPDYRILKSWYDLAESMFAQEPAATLEQDVLPVIRRVMAREQGRRPSSLKYFDAAVREKFAEDQREIARLRSISARYSQQEAS
jgi:uncharacterized protein YdaU (DUF1376 family)